MTKHKILAGAVAIVLAGCASNTAPPTPQIIYVTPAPTSIPQGAIDVPATGTPETTPEPTEEATPEPTAAPVSYKPIVVKTSTDKKTKPFFIGTQQVTITVNVKGSKVDCQFALGAAYLFPVGEDISYAGTVSTEACNKPETTEVYLEPGDYYIETLVANVQIIVTVTPHD